MHCWRHGAMVAPEYSKGQEKEEDGWGVAAHGINAAATIPIYLLVSTKIWFRSFVIRRFSSIYRSISWSLCGAECVLQKKGQLCDMERVSSGRCRNDPPISICNGASNIMARLPRSVAQLSLHGDSPAMPLKQMVSLPERVLVFCSGGLGLILLLQCHLSEKTTLAQRKTPDCICQPISEGGGTSPRGVATARKKRQKGFLPRQLFAFFYVLRDTQKQNG
ncbi:hypothetical protein HNY73_012313 [Argiope bruennichi]|uniref:Uncharacterized protein n=1 Tax=Argiope bruennichi TaxID=94029 RepID=A0A8T0EUH9_ARGBR|nr:hypothetical protein HNY73_012313 [Argiope bruennichi]